VSILLKRIAACEIVSGGRGSHHITRLEFTCESNKGKVSKVDTTTNICESLRQSPREKDKRVSVYVSYVMLFVSLTKMSCKLADDVRMIWVEITSSIHKFIDKKDNGAVPGMCLYNL